jgi:predicted nucleic acid-binding Zn ribbon protein
MRQEVGDLGPGLILEEKEDGMSLVKFECPGCGQNMECERACSGDLIHCPRCCAQIRIPFRNPSELEGSVLRAELVGPVGNATTAQHDGAPARPKQAHEASAQIECPACHAEMKVAIPVDGAPSVSLLRKPPESKGMPAPAPKPVEHAPEKAHAEHHPDFAHMSMEERERQIAAAREAHPIEVNRSMKPRLDYILSDKAAPVKKKPTEPGKDSTKTVTE